jgi:hypothetical protein
MIPIVDVSDTPPASGNTKRISINNILSSSPTASGALTVTGLVTAGSATITGAATVGTTLGVTGVSTFAAGTALLPALTTTGDVNTGIYYPAADTFAVTTGGTERYRVDSSGNVGVGVTPSARFHSKAGAVTLGGIIETGGASSLLSFADTGTSSYTRVQVGSVGNTLVGMINGVQAMTLDASGNLLVGSATNTNSSRVFIRNGSAASPSLALQGITGDTNQAGLLVGKFDNDSTSAQILVRFTINNNSGGSGQINANGASQAAFGSYSDSRLKENIVSLPSQLANILSMRPVEFDYKDGSGHQIGFVAQEIQKIYSDTVGEQDGFLTVTGWSKTEARLVSAIKELAAKVQALEAKLA